MLASMIGTLDGNRLPSFFIRVTALVPSDFRISPGARTTSDSGLRNPGVLNPPVLLSWNASRRCCCALVSGFPCLRFFAMSCSFLGNCWIICSGSMIICGLSGIIWKFPVAMSVRLALWVFCVSPSLVGLALDSGSANKAFSSGGLFGGVGLFTITSFLIGLKRFLAALTGSAIVPALAACFARLSPGRLLLPIAPTIWIFFFPFVVIMLVMVLIADCPVTSEGIAGRNRGSAIVAAVCVAFVAVPTVFVAPLKNMLVPSNSPAIVAGRSPNAFAVSFVVFIGDVTSCTKLCANSLGRTKGNINPLTAAEVNSLNSASPDFFGLLFLNLFAC